MSVILFGHQDQVTTFLEEPKDIALHITETRHWIISKILHA